MIYKMELCRPRNPKESIIDSRYFATQKGVFQNTNQLEILDEVFVQETTNKSKVAEYTTGVLIPKITLYSAIHEKTVMNTHYYFDVKGPLREGVYAFTIDKQNPEPIEAQFVPTIVSVDELLAYQKRHEDISEWRETLRKYLEEGRSEMKAIITERRKQKIEEEKAKLRRLILSK